MTLSDTDVGALIRAYRKKKKLSLMELSNRTGIAASNLSSIELGKSSPTLSTLMKIAAAFGMRAGQFLEDAFQRKAVLCPRGEGKELKTGSPEISVQVLTGDAAFSKLGAGIIRLAASSSYVHAEKTDRFVHCLEGRLSATVEDESYALHPGDSLYVLPDAALNLENKGHADSSVLVVCLKREDF
jgi:transcriptional regulator with XRE-family HTH domain